MKYYKKIRADNFIVIGGQDIIPSDSIEITEDEYLELCKLIQETAVNETEFSQLNQEECDYIE